MKLIKLTKGYFAQVDDEDYEHLNQWKWYCSETRNNRYAVRSASRSEGVGKKYYYMHRIINKTPDGLFTDHKDGNGLNNRKWNLRSCTPSQNSANRKRGYGSSKYRGVYFNRQIRKWIAGTKINNKTTILGSFYNEIDAARCYDAHCLDKYGEFYRVTI